MVGTLIVAVLPLVGWDALHHNGHRGHSGSPLNAVITIDVGATSNLLAAGHRIRVEISSSNFPRFDRNPNTGAPFGTGNERVPAQQTVFHEAARPSRIVLPVVPK